MERRSVLRIGVALAWVSTWGVACPSSFQEIPRDGNLTPEEEKTLLAAADTLLGVGVEAKPYLDLIRHWANKSSKNLMAYHVLASWLDDGTPGSYAARPREQRRRIYDRELRRANPGERVVVTQIFVGPIFLYFEHHDARQLLGYGISPGVPRPVDRRLVGFGR